MWPSGHEDKLFSLLGVNASGLPGNWFWWEDIMSDSVRWVQCSG
jgi:hypothetical protein